MSSEKTTDYNPHVCDKDNSVKVRLKAASKRQDFEDHIEYVLSVAREKLQNRCTVNTDKLAWSRVIIAACGEGNNILRDSELEDLSLRLDEVEKEMVRKNDHK